MTPTAPKRGRRGLRAAAFAVASLVLTPAFAAAQSQVQTQTQAGPFGSFAHDANQPIEITADSLAVDQAARTAVFTGEVVAGQGTLRLTAEKVTVSYGGAPGAETGRIDRLRAEGDVFLTNGTETARGAWADYDVAGGLVLMGGDVVLTQGENAISGQSLRIDLNAGTGVVSGGRVRSVFTPPARGDGG